MNSTSLRVCLFSALLLLTSCSATKLTDTWQTPALHRSQLDSVLVVGLLTNGTNRILFERGVVQAMQENGIKATASYDAIGDALPTKDSVSAYAEKADEHYVLVSRFGGADVTKERIPESVVTYYYPTYAGFWTSYGNSVTMTRDSYVDTKTSVVLTTSIYDMRTKELVWAGRSKTFEVGSVVNEANDLAHQIVASIKR
jgi:hypothetical protein